MLQMAALRNTRLGFWQEDSLKKRELAMMKHLLLWLDILPSKSSLLLFQLWYGRCIKWMFKTKHRAYGSVEKHKARFVARGFSQKEGIDYDETFSPVARYTSIRTIIAIASA